MSTLRTDTITTTDAGVVVVCPPGARNFTITISNNAVQMSSVPGSWSDDTSGRTTPPDAAALISWGPDEPTMPAIHYIDNEPTKGFRFKSRAAGQPAVVDIIHMSA